MVYINGLSLNSDKSEAEAVVVGTNTRKRLMESIDSIQLNQMRIPVPICMKNLGFILASTLSFNKHVDNVCKSANYHIRALRHIRKCVTRNDAVTVETAMVSSRLDYCNSVLYSVSAKNIAKLQYIQNTLARVAANAVMSTSYEF